MIDPLQEKRAKRLISIGEQKEAQKLLIKEFEKMPLSKVLIYTVKEMVRIIARRVRRIWGHAK